MTEMTRRIGWIAVLIVFVSAAFLSLHGMAFWIAAGAAIGFGLRVLAPQFLTRKMREWTNDLRQLRLWAQMAFTPNRDAHQTAAMAHQHQFLSGRAMSPINVFTVAPIIIALAGVAFGLAAGWRAERAERERDAPCSDIELSRDEHGNFRTSRASCAALAATADVAAQWEMRAGEIEADLQEKIDTIRIEADMQLAQERQSRARQREVVQRQRRRENEAIEAALGGAAPDLERSLCELAGRSDCGSAPAPVESGPAAAAGVPEGPGARDAAPGSRTPG